VLGFVREAARDLRATLAPRLRPRIAGLGVGLPFELWSWAERNGAVSAEMEEWRDLDAVAEIERLTGEAVFMANDVTAACGAEQAFGTHSSSDYVYFFVGAFVGGGIVVDGSLVSGRLGNAGALGSMPVSNPDGSGRVQLIHAASIHVLERMVEEAGGEGVDLWRREADWTGLGDALDQWIAVAAQGLAEAVVSATAVYDFEHAVIDGSFPPVVRARLAAAVRDALNRIERRGLSPVAVLEGTIGRSAREVGSASLPFFAKFLLDHRVLLTERA